MARSSSKNVGRWREGKAGSVQNPSPGGASKWARASLLGALMAAAVAALVAILWMLYSPDKPDPYVYAFWVDENQGRSAVDRPDEPENRLSSMVPSTPWIGADRKDLIEANIFPRLNGDAEQTLNLAKAAIETRLHALRGRKPGDSVVVYLAAGATVGDDGKVQILAHDSDPYRPKTMLPLSTVLAELKECPARHKLLVLDIMWTPADPMDLAGTADGVAEVVRDEIDQPSTSGRPVDGSLMVLGACEKGQTALVSGPMKGSVFGRFFRLGLTAPGADADGDRAVSVKELGTYLARNVDRWAWQHRGTRQRPFLTGTGADFPLVALTAPKSTDPWRWPWQKATPKPDATEAATADVAEPKKADSPAVDAARAVDKEGKGQAAGQATQAAGGYPRWLADGWAIREKWWTSGDGRVAPRVFRKLEAVLIRADRRWRMGDDGEAVRKDLASELGPLQAAMDRARDLPRPRRYRSVGQARLTPDPESVAALRKVANALPEADIPALAEKLKPKSSLEIAAAVVAALEDQPLGSRRLQFFNDLVAKSVPPRLDNDVIELRTLRQLAARAKGASAGDWSDDVAKQQWDVTLEAEAANNRPDSLPWVRDLLTLADAQKQEAEILSLGRTAGYVSLPRVAAAWEEARQSYAAVRDAQARIEGAMDLQWRAMARLGGSIPYAEGVGEAEYEQSWQRAATLARRLDQLLQRPGTPPPIEDLDALKRDLGDATAEMNRLVGALDFPFRPTEIAELARLCTAPERQPDPTLMLRIDARLSTPFLPVADRSRLWQAAKALEARLSAEERVDAEIPPEAVDRARQARDRQRSRALRIAAMLALTGDADATRKGEELTSSAEEAILAAGRAPNLARDAARSWAMLGQLARGACERLTGLLRSPGRDDGRELTGWVAPVFLLDWRADPARRALARDASDGLTWLAGHYDHAGRDNDLFDPDPVDGPEFYETAARECRTNAPEAPTASPDAALKIERLAPDGVTLSRDHPTADVGLNITAVAPATDRTRPVTIEVIEPRTPRYLVRTPSPSELELEPGQPRKVAIRVDWVEETATGAGRANPKGFVVAARGLDRRAYHQLVPAAVVSETDRPRLFVSRDPAHREELSSDRLRLRPLVGKQRLYLFVRNPSPLTPDVVVEIDGGPGQRLQVPLKLKAKDITQVLPPPGSPVVKETDPLPPLEGPLTLRLRERVDGPVIDTRRLQIDLATPDDYLADYLDVTAQFEPGSQPGRKNRLAVKLKALPKLTGPGCTARLDLHRDADLFPALREAPREGTLFGTVEPKKELDLFATNLALDPAAPEVGAFALDIDGMKRALWFTARFDRDEGVQKAQPDRRYRIRLRHEYRPDPAPATLKVRFEVDNAPADARLLVRLGTENEGQIVDGLSWDDTAKDRSLGFDPRGAEGALLFETRVEDWSHDFSVPGIRGERTLEARLVDARRRKELDVPKKLVLMLDDLAPEDVTLETPAPFLRGPSQVKLHATVTPPASGIKDVTFFLGTDPVAARAKGQAVAGSASDSTRRDWEARLPIPRDQVGEIPVTVRFTGGTGLSSVKTGSIVVLEPPPPPPDPVAEADQKKNGPPPPGAISGKVSEAERPQPGLTVILTMADPTAPGKMKQVATTKSVARGAFAFPNLQPGPYTLYCLKEATGREDRKEVMVEPGKTTAANLELLQR